MGQMATGARHRTVARRFGACAVLVPLTDARWTFVVCCGSDDGGEGSEFSVCELGTDCAPHAPLERVWARAGSVRTFCIVRLAAAVM